MLEDIPQNVRINNDDYMKNGLLMCGKCHTYKQARFTLFGEQKTVFCMCKCEKAEFDQKEEERKKVSKYAETERMRSLCFKGEILKGWRFENDDNPTSKQGILARRYVENFDKMKGLLMCGGVGTGKTFYAACIANALIDKGIPCLFTNFARLVNELQGMRDGKQEYIDSLSRYSLLIIDDLAAERDTEYMNEIVWNVIDSRYRSGKPVIVTTNLTPSEINNSTDISRQRIYSRLLEMCIPLVVDGEDKRKTKMKENCKKMKEIIDECIKPI